MAEGASVHHYHWCILSKRNLFGVPCLMTCQSPNNSEYIYKVQIAQYYCAICSTCISSLHILHNLNYENVRGKIKFKNMLGPWRWTQKISCILYCFVKYCTKLFEYLLRLPEFCSLKGFVFYRCNIGDIRPGFWQKNLHIPSQNTYCIHM